jgi:prolyl-tRNA synthetase
MFWSNAFIRTLREEPADAELASHRLMLRAGMIQKAAAGIYSYLPLGLRVIRKIETIIREEMARCGAAELLMPGVIPAELWRESGRWDYYGPELLRFTDRKHNDFLLGPTHEEVIVDIARHAVKSYRDLPVCLYQIQSKFRDEIRPRYGLMRGREFLMKDAYSFHADEQSLDDMYWRMYEAYRAVFSRCGLEFRPVEADSGTIGGDVTHEFHVLAESGEDTIAFCSHCDYAANLEKAVSRSEQAPADAPADAPAAEPVETPGARSIEAVSDFLGMAPEAMIKTLVFEVNNGEYLAAACIRGDKELNEVKLRAVLGADAVAVPDDTTVREKTGLPVGFLGAVGLDNAAIRTVIADYSVAGMRDAVTGANKAEFHLRHVYPSRDCRIDRYADLGFVSAGDRCARCEGELGMRKGIEVGQVFKLGRKYAGPMNLTFLNRDGIAETITMGCYGIGVGRTAAAAIEQHHDANGICWPVAIAPFQVAVLCLDAGAEEVRAAAREMHDALERAGVEVVLDDRDERPGVKFKDADLIGFPVRVVVGARGLKEGVVEVKRRRDQKAEKTPVASAADRICALCKDQA